MLWGLLTATILVAAAAFLIPCKKLHDRRIQRKEMAFFERAVRVDGTVEDFGIPAVAYSRSQRFLAIYEIDGKRYTVDSGLVAKGSHLYEPGEHVVVYVDPDDHSKAKLRIHQN